MARSRLWICLSLAAFVGAAAASACTSAETSSSALVGPSAGKCQYDVSGSRSAFPAAGGQGSLTIGTTRECAWTVAASAAWVSVSNRAGQGGATISYSVAENAIPSARSAVLSVEGATVELKQDAAPCRYGIDPNDERVGHAGGRITVAVQTLDGCGWTASSEAPWLTIANGASGHASGTVELMAEANTGVERVGRATIAGETLVVVQDALPPPGPAPGPPPPPAPSPDPPPEPPPPSSEPVDLRGTVGMVSGACPDVQFTIGSTVVLADASTTYQKGSCADVKAGAEVTVQGTSQPAGGVLAEHIRIDRKAHG